MNVSELNMIEVEERLAALETEVREMTDIDAVNAAIEEKRTLLERKAELAEIEQRKIDADALAAGTAKADKAEEIVKEKREMSYEVNTIEYRNAYTRHIFNLPMAEEETRALGNGGYAIPTMTVNEVVGKFKESPILNYVAISQFPSYVRFPKVAASDVANAAAAGSSISEGTNTLGYCDLTPNEYTKLVSLTADVQNMAIDALHDWLVNDIVTNIRAKVAADVLVGNGTNKCSGITASVSASQTNLHSTLTKADILGVMAALPAQYHAGAIWVMTPALFYNEVMSLTTLNDYVINDGFTQKLFGHDVVLMSEACISTKETIFFGDPKSYKLNFFRAIEIKPFEVATSMSTQYRGGALVDGELADANAFVRFAKA